MNRVLVISHFFPPCAGSGVLRTTKFVKYLIEFGWECTILTLHTKHCTKVDETLLSQIPLGTRIYRTSFLDPVGTAIAIRKNYLTQILRRDRTIVSKNLTQQSYTSICPAEQIHFQKNMGKGAVDALQIPDRYIGWLIPGFVQGLKAIIRHEIRAIYSTSPSSSTHIVAMALQKATKIPWVADFRDPWKEDDAFSRLKTCRRHIERKMECAVLHGADVVVATTQRLGASLATRTKEVAKERKIHVITNGYDEEDFAQGNGPIGARQSKRFIVSHIGEFYERLRTPDSFLRAIASLMHSKFLEPESLVVSFIGGGEYTRSLTFRHLIHQLGVETIVQFIDYLPHKDCIKKLLESDILLLLQNSEELFLQTPAKIYEYARTGKPIFSIAPAGATADMVESLEWAKNVYEVDNTQVIEEEFKNLVQKLRDGSFRESNKRQLVTKFERRNLTRRLAAILDGLVEHSARNLGPQGSAS